MLKSLFACVCIGSIIALSACGKATEENAPVENEITDANNAQQDQIACLTKLAQKTGNPMIIAIAGQAESGGVAPEYLPENLSDDDWVTLSNFYQKAANSCP